MAFGVEAASGTSTGGATSLSHSFTVTSANLLLVGVSIGFSNANPQSNISSVTYGGVGMTAVSGSDSDDNNFEGVRWYRLDNPAAGTANVVVNVTTSCQIGLGAVSFTQASLTLKTPSINTNTTTNPSVTVVDSANTDIVVSALASDATSSLTQAGSLIYEAESVAGDSDFGAQYQTATGASTVCSWTLPEAIGWATSGLAVADGSVVAATRIPFVGSFGRPRARYAF